MLEISNGVFAVKFGAKWCAPCKLVDRTLEKMQSEFSTINFMFVDVDDEPELAKQYRIKNLPTIILFNDGVEVNRITGAVLTEPMRKVFRDLIEQAA